LLGLGVAADESDHRKLIEVHGCFSLSARLPGAPESEVAAAPKLSECFV
jgi:hypothetical protein